MSALSKSPVGSARAEARETNSSNSKSQRARTANASRSRASGGSEAARFKYPRNAGRRNIAGSNGSACASLSMNIATHLARRDAVGEPGAMNAPELTPT